MKRTMIIVVVPHVGVANSCQRKKAYFLGYMAHRLLMAALGRRKLDDRDYNGNKRLGLADLFMAFLFRALFKTLMKEALRCGLKLVNQNKQFKNWCC